MTSIDGRWRLAGPCVWLPTADEMAALDRRAVAESIPERALIENAGRALASRVHARWPEAAVVALAGSGHNGADALVAARTLRAWGHEVRAIGCGSASPQPDVLVGWELPLEEPDALDIALAAADVILDGIFGTGLRSAPREPQASMIARLDGCRAAVVAVDGPSGVDFTTGAVPGAAARAELTVTFGWPKLGLLRFPARSLCGEIEAVEIGFPPPDPPPAARLVTAAWAAELLGRRPADAHKGEAGYLTILAGQPGMAGASVLAARAAIRAGAGIVRVAGAPENREIVQTAVPAAVFVPWDDDVALREAVEWADAVAIGPGLGNGPGRRELVEAAFAAAGDRPTVVDADGLNVWAGEVDALSGALPAHAILTPHPGEIRRLLDIPSGGDGGADPAADARALAARTGARVLLKGAPTWVALPDGRLRVTGLLSVGFATGGMGDVLTGLVGAYAASGLAPEDAAVCALTVSAIATLEGGEPVGHSADDVPDAVPAARAALGSVTPGAVGGVLASLPAALGSDDGSDG